MASNTPLCGICQNRNVNNTAVIWCNDCDEGLCSSCNGFHEASKGSRRHDTLDIAAYLKIPAQKRKTGQRCIAHNKRYSSFCKKHDAPCCEQCVIAEHTACKDIIDICDVSSNVSSSVAFTEIELRVSHILRKFRELHMTQEVIKNSIQDQKRTIKDQIKQVRENISAHLDKLQDSLLQELDSMTKSEQKNIEVLKTTLHQYQCDLIEYKDTLSVFKHHATAIQTFLAMKHIEKDITQLIKHAETHVRPKVTNEIRIKFDQQFELKNITKDVSSFGTLCLEKNTLNVDFQPCKAKQVQIRSVPQNLPIGTIRVTLEQTVKTGCKNVNGILILPDNRFVFTCLSSKKVVVMNSDGSGDFEVKTKDAPYDLTYNADIDSIIVSFLNNRISFINVREKKEAKTIDVRDIVGGICRYKSSVVCCTKGGIKMIDMEGRSQTIISTDLSWVDYVDASSENIVFTCYKAHSVTCCDINGHILWNIRDPTILKFPRGISVDSRGNVFIVDGETNNVTVISADGQHHREIISANDGPDEPRAIHFCRKQSKILVSNTYNGKAFLFNVTI